MKSSQPYLEVRAGLLNGVELDERRRRSLWKIFDYVVRIIKREMNEYSSERGEHSSDRNLHYEIGEDVHLPDDLNEKLDKIKAEAKSVHVLILAISPHSSSFSHSNCLTRESIALVQVSINDLVDLPDVCRIGGPILHELCHALLVPHTRRGVMHDGIIPEENEVDNELPPLRCMGNIETTILSHHPVMIDIESVSGDNTITVCRTDEKSIEISPNVVYCVVLRSTVAERIIDWQGVEERIRVVSRLEEEDTLVVCTQFSVKCLAISSLPIKDR
ncbi:hypothetical protein PFISCL1PPCAC_2202 [Pristionchus fissidentatus]|uniref:Uncharacterized protein n=1 Tax=Pristionchus fissidentatus TaxID=1538716 RepID=A0AAV5UZD2_9BILA|nr:hypothetical protein PFISCL1PPCAC_2202 [Pristionchus fissidentatus]